MRLKVAFTMLVSQRVRVWWAGDKRWFAGVVTSYSSHRGHQVQYDDGSVETHVLDSKDLERWKLE